MEFNELEMIQKIKASIQEADKVLIGIGNEFDVKWADGEGYDSWEEAVNCQKKIADLEKALPQDVAYKNLKELLKDKDYYIISLAMDDAIYRVFDDEDKIVTPCGGFRRLQCENGCEHEVVPYDGSEGQKICAHCGGKMVFNNLKANTYVEEGYLDNFAAYKKWLQTTINRKLCIIELGAGMKFPGVIRFAFDKMAYYNQKCDFYRVHESLYQHTAENHERGISVPANSLSLMQSKAFEITE